MYLHTEIFSFTIHLFSALCEEEGRVGIKVDWLYHCNLWREDHSLCCCRGHLLLRLICLNLLAKETVNTQYTMS